MSAADLHSPSGSSAGLPSPGGPSSAAGGGSNSPLQVLLNVYDVAQQGESKNTVVRLNNLLGPKGVGLGGVFHGAIVLGTVEFSFGFCDQGTGVYAVKAGQNPMYTFRETVDLGATSKSMAEIRGIIQQLKQEWPGSSYDLLYRNCCHFCVDLAAQLGVGPVPGWLNRFASGAAATINITQDTVKTVQEFGAEVGRLWNKTLAAASQQQQQLSEKLQQQQLNWRNGNQQQQQQQGGQQQHQQQQQQRSVSTTNPARAQLEQAGQHLWSSFTQAGQHLRATTSRLAAQAAATATGATATTASKSSAGSGTGVGGVGVPRFGSFASNVNGSSTSATAQHAGDAADAQQQQQESTIERSSSAQLLPLGAQPKLSKQYRLSSGHSSSSDTVGATAGAGGGLVAGSSSRAPASSGGGGGSNNRLQQSFASSGGGSLLMPFHSIDDVGEGGENDPFVSLVGDDDAEDDATQRAAVDNAMQQQHVPPSSTQAQATAAATAAQPPVVQQ